MQGKLRIPRRSKQRKQDESVRSCKICWITLGQLDIGPLLPTGTQQYMHPWVGSMLQIQENETHFQVLYQQVVVKKRYCSNEFCTNEGLYMWALYKQVVVQTSFFTYEGVPHCPCRMDSQIL